MNQEDASSNLDLALKCSRISIHGKLPFHLEMNEISGEISVVPGAKNYGSEIDKTSIVPGVFPSLHLSERIYLEKQLSIGQFLKKERMREPLLSKIIDQTWPVQPGPSLSTLNIRNPRKTLRRVPAADFLVSRKWITIEEDISKSSNVQKAADLEKPSITISNYTRGTTGTIRPFTPGGLSFEKKDLLKETENNPSSFLDENMWNRSNESVQKSLVIFGKWKDEDLISKPPKLNRGLKRSDLDSSLTQSGDVLVEDIQVSQEKPVAVKKLDINQVDAASFTRKDKINLASILCDDDLSSSDLTSSEADEEEEAEDENREVENHEKNVSNSKDSIRINKNTVAFDLINQEKEDIDVDEENVLDALLGIYDPEVGRDASFKQREIVSNLLGKGKEEFRESWAVTSLIDISNFRDLVPNPPIQFPFELDGFQKQAVVRLERKECVFVAAHTSAGKTVVAEYAIALAQSHMTRAAYTSPIKALSNQKYRDFKKKFGDNVGLITGDVSINPEASCLIMTTEILRSMLYRGADLVRDIEWVIFDEVHYINDTERGVVWEEVIIMLPDHTNMIFLSATTPNTIEFSDWIGRTKRKPVHVITTDYRPVPLQHFIFAGNEMHKIMDQEKRFISEGYSAAVAKLIPKEEKKQEQQQVQRGRGVRGGPRAVSGGRGKQTNAGTTKFGPRAENKRVVAGKKNQWQSMAYLLIKENLTPTVIFSFSKKVCEEGADALSSGDYTNAKEKSSIRTVCSKSISRLDPEDVKLPQVKRIRDMLCKGVAVHHGGLLPILKETVEILFSQGAVKFLFATETFAMGVNMPARTVVFNGIRKHDGKDFRDLLPGEYTQMAGRAGRRGLDKVGTVLITAWAEPPPLISLKVMLTGSATKLESQFRLKYNMILNLLRVEVMSVEGMIKRSFSEFATQRALGAHDLPKFIQRAETTLVRMEKKIQSAMDNGTAMKEVKEYMKLTEQASTVQAHLFSYLLMKFKGVKSLVAPGRVLIVSTRKFLLTPALILKSEASEKEPTAAFLSSASGTNPAEEIGPIIIMVLCDEGFIMPKVEKPEKEEPKFEVKVKKRFDPFEDLSSRGGTKTTSKEPTLKPGDYGTGCGRVFTILEIDAFSIVHILRKRASADINKIVYGSEKGPVDSAVKSMSLPNKLDSSSIIDMVREFKITDLDAVLYAKDLRLLNDQKAALGCESLPDFKQLYHMEFKYTRLLSKIQQVKSATSNERLQLFPDFQQRLQVLRQLGYVDREGDTVQLKGRVACEVNTADELIVTEIVFENVLQNLSPPEIAGILSALVFQEKSDNEPPLTPNLKMARSKIEQIANFLGSLQYSCGLPIAAEEFMMKSLNFGLVDVVYDWARGVPFAEICEITTVQEGSIVRTITRLDELLREVRNAGRVVGDPTLYRKMEATSQLIRRGVIFCASLYV